MMPELLPFADDMWAAAGATNETAMLGCPECVKDLAKYKSVWLGGHAASPWYLMCASPIASYLRHRGQEGARDRRLRLPDDRGPRRGRRLPIGDRHRPPRSSKRQIDCAVGPLTWLTTLGLIDSVKGVVDQPLGSYHGLGEFVFNTDSLARIGRGRPRRPCST